MFREVKEKIFDRVTKQVLELSEILDQHSEREPKLGDEENCNEHDEEGDENGMEVDDEEENEENGESNLSSKSKELIVVEPLEYDLEFLAKTLKENASVKESYGATRHAVFRLCKR